MRAQKWRRGIALIFHEPRHWMEVSETPHSGRFIPGKETWYPFQGG